VLIGYASNGLHTNGYTLARQIVFDTLGLDIGHEFPETGQSVAQVLLAVHRSYATAVTPVISRPHALAHITGGGIAGNVVRVLPPDCEAVIDARAWRWPAVFRVLMRAGRVSLSEMRRVFNLGVGMIGGRAACPGGDVAGRRGARRDASGQVRRTLIPTLKRGLGTALC